MGKCVSKGSLTHNSHITHAEIHVDSNEEREWDRILSYHRENNNLTDKKNNAEVTIFLFNLNCL